MAPLPVLEDVAQAICAQSGFRFEGIAGIGAFKETFKVGLPDNTAAALKVHRPGLPTQRTQRELEAMVKCQHHNIAKLYSVNTFDWQGSPHLYTLEEFVPGGTLATRLQTIGPFSTPDSKQLGRQLIDAVGHIASNGLVHRDLKPDNIMLREDGSTPVIVDFGLVRYIGDTSITASWLARGPGTPWFAAPEQLNNEKALIDWRTDQFALGVVMGMATFEVHPYAVAGEAAQLTVERVAHRGGVNPDFVSRAQAAGMGQLVRMVAKWPVERFRTPVDLAVAWT